MSGTIVIKVGGGEGIDIDPVLAEIPGLLEEGLRVVVVHGGSHETNVVSQMLGVPPRTLRSPSGHTSRRTDRATLEIFEMVYCGKINKGVVERLRGRGVDAVGLSGIDGGLWTGSRKTAIRAVEGGRTVVIRDDLSGRVERVDDGLLRLLLEDGRTPVLTPPAMSEDGLAMNVDADRASAATASALGAEELLLLSNVPGVLRDPADPGSLIGSVGEVGMEVVRGAAKGRMKTRP